MTLTSAILSWHSTLTLVNTLESYKYYGLDKLATQKVIFFQEITTEDMEIARDFGYQFIGSTVNIGIGAAYKELVDFSASDLFLFLENDWELIEPPLSTIIDAQRILTMDNPVDVVKLRHRKNPGAPLWSATYKGREETPEGQRYLLDSIHWTDDPIPFRNVIPYSTDWYMAWSKYANWTNNPTMFRTDWLRQNIVPRLSGDIERAIQPWWESESRFIVAQHRTGLFTHRRLDR